MGEFLGGEEFRLIDFSLQEFGGTIANFQRDPAHANKELEKFFERTGRDFNRFNYIGEWHSHPCFDVTPSLDDVRSMYSITGDANVGAYRAVLMIVRLEGRELAMSVTEFRSNAPPTAVDVELEGSALGGPRGCFLRMRFWLFGF